MVWAYGKVQPGWYCARWVHDMEYVAHLRSLGYSVRVQNDKPTLDDLEG